MSPRCHSGDVGHTSAKGSPQQPAGRWSSFPQPVNLPHPKLAIGGDAEHTEVSLQPVPSPCILQHPPVTPYPHGTPSPGDVPTVPTPLWSSQGDALPRWGAEQDLHHALHQHSPSSFLPRAYLRTQAAPRKPSTLVPMPRACTDTAGWGWAFRGRCQSPTGVFQGSITGQQPDLPHAQRGCHDADWR